MDAERENPEPAEPAFASAPRLSHWLWRPLYAKLWWAFAAIFWLVGGAWRMLAFNSDVTFLQMAWPTLITGVFMVMFFVPVTGLAMASVEHDEQANAAGLSNFMRTLAGAFATSLIQSGWSNAARFNQTEIAGAMTNGKHVLDMAAGMGVDPPVATSLLTQIVEGQSVMLATLNMFGVIALCLGVAATIIWLVPKPKGPIDTSGAH